jgi:uncharacterized protein (TIGR03437 family)
MINASQTTFRSTEMRLTVHSALLLSSLSLISPFHAQGQGTLSGAASPNWRRVGASATTLRDGRVLFAGGVVLGSGQRLADAEVYDLANGRFTATGRMISPRSNHSAVLMADGRVLLAGGYMFGCSGIRCQIGDGSAEVYDPGTGAFLPVGKMVLPQANTSAVALPGNKVLFVGGNLAQMGAAIDVPAEIYDGSTQTFRQLDWGVGWMATATLLPNGKVFIAGGANTPECYLYDPVTDSRTSAGSLSTYPYGVYWHSAIHIGNGKVLITGGTSDSDATDTLGNVEIYDSATGRFTDVGSMLEPRRLHGMTLLPGGTVLIGQSTLEVFDPATTTFSRAGTSSDFNLSVQSSTLLPNGQVLIMRGSPNYEASLYNPMLRAVSAASFAPVVAPASLSSLVGSQLADTTATAASRVTSLGGISLRVRDIAGQARPAFLLYVSPSQINFEIPEGTAIGLASVEVLSTGSSVPPVSVSVHNVAPGLFTLGDNRAAAYGVRVEVDGSQTVLPVSSPITLGDRPVVLALFGTGFRNRSSLAAVQAKLGGINLPVGYAGPEGGGTLGLDQINVELPPALKGNRDRELTVTVDGVTSNSAFVDVR